jgi:hypothetical protein
MIPSKPTNWREMMNIDTLRERFPDYNSIRPHNFFGKRSPEQFLKEFRNPLSPVAPGGASDEQGLAQSRCPQVVAAGLKLTLKPLMMRVLPQMKMLKLKQRIQ